MKERPHAAASSLSALQKTGGLRARRFSRPSGHAHGSAKSRFASDVRTGSGGGGAAGGAGGGVRKSSTVTSSIR